VAGEAALHAFSGPVVLVAGGNTKHLPLAGWPASIIQSCRDLILLKGSGTDELLPALEAEARTQGKASPLRGVFDDYNEAMRAAVALTHPGDTLLFSPGLTSFGMFLNEFDRGDKFVAFVEGLKG
jgi:UDP-N-acetylmuramoylalanine--D-glutamate ligase